MAKRSSSDDMKIKNLVQLVSLVIHNRGINRKKISTITGLSNQTVTNLAKELIERNIIHEFEIDSKGQGRPPIGLEFNYSKHLLVTVEITFDHVRILLHDLSGKVFSEDFQKASLGCDLSGMLLDGIKRVIGNRRYSTIYGIVIAAEGVIDEYNSRIIFIKSLGVSDLDVRETLRPLRIPVLLVNDVNLVNFDMSTKYTDIQNWMTIKYASGMGASTAIQRRILRSGEYNMPGKIGHIKIEGTGEHNKCWCGGENCVGTFFCKDGLENKFHKPYTEVLQGLRDGRYPEYREFMLDKMSMIFGAYVTLIGLERILVCGNSADILGPDFFREMDERVGEKLPPWVSYKGMTLVDIEPVTTLSSAFFINYIIDNIYAYMDYSDELQSQ